ncbi:MAG: Glutamate N-acetyltransferase @ N-acetylglutamate synthase, partial [uncultured Thermoleophilia bacterium]
DGRGDVGPWLPGRGRGGGHQGVGPTRRGARAERPAGHRGRGVHAQPGGRAAGADGAGRAPGVRRA